MMDAFPFSNADWERVKDATFPIVNARLVDAGAVADSLFIALQEILQELRCEYGDHPILLETEADFCDDVDESLRLYGEALSVANLNGLPIHSICLSYVRVLVDADRDAKLARFLLDSCRESIYANSDKTDIEAHDELSGVLELRRGDGVK